MAKNTYGNRVRDANAAYRGAIAQIAGSTTVDHADQFRDYDLAIVDLMLAVSCHPQNSCEPSWIGVRKVG